MSFATNSTMLLKDKNVRKRMGLPTDDESCLTGETSIPVDYQIKLLAMLEKHAANSTSNSYKLPDDFTLPLPWPAFGIITQTPMDGGPSLLQFAFPKMEREPWGRHLGHVYQAVTSFGPVALRLLQPASTDVGEQSILDKYHNELLLHRFLSHPNIVRCSALVNSVEYHPVSGQVSGGQVCGTKPPVDAHEIQPPLIVSEWCVNKSLFSHLSASPSFALDWSMDRKLKLAKQIALAMDYLHEQGIVHPLTAKSILFTANFDAKLSNAGLHPLLKKTASVVDAWKLKTLDPDLADAKINSPAKHIHNRNWHGYLAPELLPQRANVSVPGRRTTCGKKNAPVALTENLTTDVYAYGSLLWEIFRSPSATLPVPAEVKDETKIEANSQVEVNAKMQFEAEDSVIQSEVPFILKTQLPRVWQGRTIDSTTTVVNSDKVSVKDPGSHWSNDAPPTVLPYFPPKISELITACWNKDPDARPKFAQIVAALNA